MSYTGKRLDCSWSIWIELNKETTPPAHYNDIFHAELSYTFRRFTTSRSHTLLVSRSACLFNAIINFVFVGRQIKLMGKKQKSRRKGPQPWPGAGATWNQRSSKSRSKDVILGYPISGWAKRTSLIRKICNAIARNEAVHGHGVKCVAKLIMVLVKLW